MEELVPDFETVLEVWEVASPVLVLLLPAALLSLEELLCDTRVTQAKGQRT